MPSAPARMDQPSDRPSAGPTKPIGMVKYWKFPQEPQHGLLPGLAVPFGVWNPVDRVHLDLAEQPALLFFLDRGFPGLCGHGRLPARCDLPHEL